MQLPTGELTVRGEQIPLQSMIGAMLVLIPAHCNCSAAISTLAEISSDEGTVLVGTQRTFTEAQDLELQLNPRTAANVSVALDWQKVLPRVVRPHGLTAVVITGATARSGRQWVAYASQLTARDLSANGGSLSLALIKAVRG